MIRIASLSVVFLLICQQALTQVVGEIKNVRFYKWKYKDSVTYEMMVTNEAFTKKIFTGLVSAPATVRVRFLGAKNTEAIIQFNTEITKDIYDGNEIFLVGGRRAGMTFIKGEVGTKVPTFYCVFVHNMNGELLNGAVTQENFIDKLMDGEADGIQFTQPVVELQPDVTYAKESRQAKFARFYNKNDKLYARIDEYIDSHTEDGMSGDELIAKLTKGQKNIFDEEQSAPQTRSGYRESLEDIFYNGDHPFNFKFQNSDGVMITTGRVEFLLSVITAFYDHPNGNRYFERYELPNKIIKNITIESRAIDGQFSEVVVTLPEKIKTSVEKSARVAGPFEMTNKMHFFMSTGRIEEFKKLITGYLSVTY